MELEKRRAILAHLTALAVIVMWGTTFVATKVLLRELPPEDIMFFRFLLAYAALWIAYPRPVGSEGWRREGLYLAAGLCGVTGYFLLENMALTYSYASNVSLVISVAPMLTALFAHFLLRDEPLRGRFFLGFVIAISGVALVTLNGNLVLKLSPAGDMLAVLAACCWGMYSVIMRRLTAGGHHPAAITRRVFFYGLLTMAPVFLLRGHLPDLTAFTRPTCLFNLLFLGLGASALGFVLWNRTVGVLGAVKTSAYIYLQPVATLVTAALVLHERMSPLMLLGGVLTLTGLVLAETGKRHEKKAAGGEVPSVSEPETMGPSENELPAISSPGTQASADGAKGQAI